MSLKLKYFNHMFIHQVYLRDPKDKGKVYQLDFYDILNTYKDYNVVEAKEIWCTSKEIGCISNPNFVLRLRIVIEGELQNEC